jgi:hypothetical protein
MNLEEAKKNYEDLEYPGLKTERVSFLKALLSVKSKGLSDKKIIAGLIFDFLSDQVALYDYLKHDDQTLIYKWVDTNWEENLNYVDLNLSIICQLEADRSRVFLLQCLQKDANEDVKSLINEVLTEY